MTPTETIFARQERIAKEQAPAREAWIDAQIDAIAISYTGPGYYFLCGPVEAELPLGDIIDLDDLHAAVREAVEAGSGDQSWHGWTTECK